MLQPLPFHSRAVMSNASVIRSCEFGLFGPIALTYFTLCLLKHIISVRLSLTGAFSTLLPLSCKLEIQ